MNFLNRLTSVAAGAKGLLPVRKINCSAWLVLVLVFSLCAARADKQDDDYLDIYGLIDQADALNAGGKTSAAHAKYVEAQWALAQFQQANPGWNTRTVTFRLNYLTEKVAATSGQTAVVEKTAVVENHPPAVEKVSVTPVLKNEVAPPAPKSPVNVLDAGGEHRVALRLHPRVGDRQTLVMTLKMAMATSLAGKDLPAMNLPAMVLTMDINVKDVAANGDITYDLVFSDATVATDTNVMPAVATAMKASLAGLHGLTGSGTMSSQGIVNNVEIKLPASADPQLIQTMNQMKESFSTSSTPLPEVAVGAGAKWEYPTRIKSQGMTIEQTMTYELVSIVGDRLTLRSTITQTANSQKIQNPAMPGLKVDLDKLSGTGTGNSTFDLTRLMPITGTLTETMETSMTIPMGQQKQSMTMKMTMNIGLETK